MNDFRIIIYNVELPELEKAIQKAIVAYEQKYAAKAKTLTVQKSWTDEAKNLIDSNDLQLQLDRFYASPGTVQAGE